MQDLQWFSFQYLIWNGRRVIMRKTHAMQDVHWVSLQHPTWNGCKVLPCHAGSAFVALATSDTEYVQSFVWPCRFLARLGRNAISVYEAPEMVLLDKKSLKLEGIQDFEWSPAADILCAYQSEQAGGNLPARISLIRLPDRAELRQKNLFSVSGECGLLFIL